MDACRFAVAEFSRLCEATAAMSPEAMEYVKEVIEMARRKVERMMDVEEKHRQKGTETQCGR